MTRVKKTAAAVFVAMTAWAVCGQVTVSVDLYDTRQTIVGFGSMVPGSDEINDLEVTATRMCWDPEYNGGLERQNDNADPNDLNISAFTHTASYINSFKAAKAAGCDIFISSVWSPPLWMKSLAEHAYEDQGQWQCPNLVGLCGGFLKLDTENRDGVKISNQPHLLYRPLYS